MQWNQVDAHMVMSSSDTLYICDLLIILNSQTAIFLEDYLPIQFAQTPSIIFKPRVIQILGQVSFVDGCSTQCYYCFSSTPLQLRIRGFLDLTAQKEQVDQLSFLSQSQLSNCVNEIQEILSMIILFTWASIGPWQSTSLCSF